MARVASPRQIAEAHARKSGFLGENLGSQAIDAACGETVQPEYEGGDDAEDKLDGGDNDWGQRWVEARSSFLLQRGSVNGQDVCSSYSIAFPGSRVILACTSNTVTR